MSLPSPLFSFFFLFLLLPRAVETQESAAFGAAKFAPADGEKLLIIGQDLGAVGGLRTHNDGYIDHITSHLPSGITTYTSLPSLGGLTSVINWGAGDVNGNTYLKDNTFENTTIAVGLYLVDELFNISMGFHDNEIERLARWIKKTKRPVFLRIGYEFDGSWNHYDPIQFKEAWWHIVELFDKANVNNVAYVWQSAGINTANIEEWYPGDAYVNWVGYSHFDGPNPGQRMRDFALIHQKPIIIAEATPRLNLAEGDGEAHWKHWYQPLFDTIYANDNIKALAYINANWEAQPMWIGKGWGDARVEINDFVLDAWKLEMNKKSWCMADENLFCFLDYELWTDTKKNLKEASEQVIEVQQSEGQINIRSLDQLPLQQLLLWDKSKQLLLQKQDIANSYIITTDHIPAGELTLWIKTGGYWYKKVVVGVNR